MAGLLVLGVVLHVFIICMPVLEGVLRNDTVLHSMARPSSGPQPGQCAVVLTVSAPFAWR